MPQIRRNQPDVDAPVLKAMGIAPKYQMVLGAVEVVATLSAAGHRPAALSDADAEDWSKGNASGFMVIPRQSGSMFVYQLVEGYDGGAISEHRDELKKFARTLEATGKWMTETPIGRCVRAHRIESK